MNPVYLIYFVLIVIALIILWAYIRCFFKRLKCLFSITRMCRKHGFQLKGKHPRGSWAAGTQSGATASSAPRAAFSR